MTGKRAHILLEGGVGCVPRRQLNIINVEPSTVEKRKGPAIQIKPTVHAKALEGAGESCKD